MISFRLSRHTATLGFCMIMLFGAGIDRAEAQMVTVSRDADGYRFYRDGELVERLPSAREALLLFESGPVTPGGRPAHLEFLTLGFIRHSDILDAAIVDSITSGLERIAIEAREPRVRLSAVSWLAMAGTESSPRPLPETITRLERIYASTPDLVVRKSIALRMSEQLERTRAADFLEAVVREGLTGDELFHDSLVHYAVSGLDRSEAGRARLDALTRDVSVDELVRDNIRAYTGRGRSSGTTP